MKRFEFKLQAVLTLRQRTEQAALEKYGRAIRHRQLAADRLMEAEMELSDARRQWLHALADGCPAARAAQMLGFCHLLEERKQQCEQSLNLADVELNQASQRMLQARQEREAVENFLSRQRQRHDRRLLEEERKEAEECGMRNAERGLSNAEFGMRNAESRTPHSEPVPPSAFVSPSAFRLPHL